MSSPKRQKLEKKQILFNAFEVFAPGHANPGQWAHPGDRSIEKIHSIKIWEENAKLLEKGKFLSYFIGDTFGGLEIYGGSRDAAIEIGTEFPVLDPFQLAMSMANVTTNLGFGITSSTTFEPPFLLARRFSTLDHLTKGRIGWNIVTSWNNAQARAVGHKEITAHDERYAIAHEYMDLLYKFWESSMADDVLVQDAQSSTLFDPKSVKIIKHEGKYFQAETPFIVHPSIQRVPFLFQAGTSKTGIEFAATHAEGVFVAGLSPSVLAGKVAKMRQLAKEKNRDPQSIKIFALLTPIVGKDDKDAQEKFEVIKKHRLLKGGLIFFSGITGIDLSKYDIDEEINSKDSKIPQVVQGAVENLFNEQNGEIKWTPRKVAEQLSIGGNGPYIVGGPETVADYIEEFVKISDVDGFNITPVNNPSSYEDIVEYLIPELQRRGVYWKDYPNPEGSLRSQVQGHDRVSEDHAAYKYKYTYDSSS